MVGVNTYRLNGAHPKMDDEVCPVAKVSDLREKEPTEWYAAHQWTTVFTIDDFIYQYNLTGGEHPPIYDSCGKCHWRVRLASISDFVIFELDKKIHSANWLMYRVHLAVIDSSGKECFAKASRPVAIGKMNAKSKMVRMRIPYLDRSLLIGNPNRFLPKGQLTIHFTVQIYHRRETTLAEMTANLPLYYVTSYLPAVNTRSWLPWRRSHRVSLPLVVPLPLFEPTYLDPDQTNRFLLVPDKEKKIKKCLARAATRSAELCHCVGNAVQLAFKSVVKSTKDNLSKSTI